MGRKIIHIDMDAFFASVEQRDFPELKGRPVVVGGKPDSRGVVATCSYEARQYGIHSAMPTSHAYRLCPHAVFVKPRFSAYKEASEAIHKIFKCYTDLIEPLSLDEAYLDVSDTDICEGSATLMAKAIRDEIFNTIKLTASAGVSYNKFLAKLASDQNKPNGQFLIRPGEAEQFLKELPVGRFYGVGKVTEARMHDAGIKSGADLKEKSLLELQMIFGNSAEYYYDIARGIDRREVTTHRIRKSFGSETTYQSDLNEAEEMLSELLDLSRSVLLELKQKELNAYTVTIKIKYSNFQQITRSYTSDSVISSYQDLQIIIPGLLKKTEVSERSVRLLGVSFSNLLSSHELPEYDQLSLF